MIAIAVIDVLGLLAIIGIGVGMLYLANRIEPHWVAKSQRRFLTVAHDLDQFGLPTGRKREVRVHVDPGDEALLVRSRSMTRPSSGIWTVHAKAPKPPRGRVVYVLKKVSGTSATDTMALRLPDKSKMIPRLEELLAATRGGGRRSAAPAENEAEPDHPEPDGATPDSDDD